MLPAYTRPVEIRADQLLLRPPRPSDLRDVVAACSDPEIPRFLPLVPAPYRPRDGRKWLAQVARRWEDADPERTFAIVDHDQFAGIVTVRLTDWGSVGYWLRSEARGRGLMTRAVEAVVAWARREHGIERLFITAHPDNLASQRVAEKAGFIRTGVTVHRPPFRDGSTSAIRFELR